MKSSQIELLALVEEANELANKPGRLTEQEQRRNTFLLSAISVMKLGVSLRDLEEHNEIRATGATPGVMARPAFTATSEQRAHAKAWGQFAKNGKVDLRDQGIGTVAAAYMNGNDGSLVPTGFFNDVKAAMAQADPLVDPNVVTYVETKNGAPIQFPLYSDVDNVATVATENATDSSNSDIETPGAVLPPVFTYRTKTMWKTSIEALQDIDTAIPLLALFTKFSADRIARGVGADLVSGNGSGKPLGLVPSLQNLGATITAQGSAANTGGSEDGSNSIGSADIAAIFFSVNAAYRAQPTCAWLANDTTLQFLCGLNDKMGRPIVNLTTGIPTILGKKVLVSPSLDDIGLSQAPLIFGALDYWCTRCVTQDGLTRVQRFTQAPGLVENGKVGFKAFARYGGSLLYTASGAKSPIKALVNFS